MGGQISAGDLSDPEDSILPNIGYVPREDGEIASTFTRRIKLPPNLMVTKITKPANTVQALKKGAGKRKGSVLLQIYNLG